MTKKQNGSLVKYGAGILVLLLLLAIVSGCTGRDYKEAAELFAAGSYTDAEEAFTKIAEYKDSQQLSIASRVYQYLEQGKYADAARLYGQISE